MRARNLKPGFFKNELLAECSPLARLLFAGLWCLADREGRLEDRPSRIKAEILPYDADTDMNALLDQLASRGFIARYHADDRRVIQVLTFVEHQKPYDREVCFNLPEMPDQFRKTSETNGELAPLSCSPLPVSCSPLPVSLLPLGGVGSDDKTADLPAVEETPARNGSSPKKPRVKRKPDPLFDAIALVTASDPIVSGSHVGRLATLLRSADPPYSPEEVQRWADMVTQASWWSGGHPSLAYMEKDIGRVRSKGDPGPGKYRGMLDFLKEDEGLFNGKT